MTQTNTQEDVVTPTQMENARLKYANARESLRNAIDENRKAMLKYRAQKTEENKVAYEATRKAHADAIQKIQHIRHAHDVLRYKFINQR